jgi:hypothetical protein
MELVATMIWRRLGKACYVAMAENGEDAGKQRYALPVDLGELVAQVTHQSLRHGQADDGHGKPPSAGLFAAATVRKLLFHTQNYCNTYCIS